MRRVLPLVLLLTVAACDPYNAVVEADTIEAYDAWLRDNPDGRHTLQATARLQDLMLERARASGDPADFDAYLDRFPQGAHVETAKSERRSRLFRAAYEAGTVAAWERFLADYPKTPDTLAQQARDGLAAARYAPSMTMTPVTTARVNLAEDPAGPLNGTAFRTEVTNTGDRTLSGWWLRIFYLDGKGEILAHDAWPVVERPLGFPTPMPDDASVPMKPGDTRVWEWTTGDLPEGFSGTVRVQPMRVRFAEAG